MDKMDIHAVPSLMLLFIMLIHNTETMVLIPSCPPAEEGKNHTLVFQGDFNLDSLNRVYVIHRDSTAIAKCFLPRSCTNYFIGSFEANVAASNVSQLIKITVNINNVSRDSPRTFSNNWYIADNNIITTICTVQIYSINKIIQCGNLLINDDLRVNCWMSRLFPEGKCQASMKLHQVNGNRTIIDVNYTNIEVSSDLTYFILNCTFVIPKSNIDSEKFEIWVTMYPNITGQDDDTNSGVTKIINIDSEQLIITIRLRDCPKIVEENSDVTCYCEGSELPLANYSVSWFDNISGEAVAVGFGASSLNFKANRKMETSFHCRASNSAWIKHVINATVLYLPTIIAKVLEIHCSLIELGEIYSLTCTADGVYPPAQCNFLFTSNQNVTQKEKISIEHKTITDDPTSYKSTCTLSLPKLNVRQGLHHILVQMYPNVTGNYRDITYGTNVSFTFTKEVDKVLDHFSSKNVITGICVVVGAMFILITGVLMWRYTFQDVCVTCTHPEKKQNTYDEINDGYVLAVTGVYTGDGQSEFKGYRKLEARERDRAHEMTYECNDYESVDELQIHVKENPTTIENTTESRIGIVDTTFHELYTTTTNPIDISPQTKTTNDINDHTLKDNEILDPRLNDVAFK